MSLFNPDKLQTWRYSVRSCIILINGEVISLSPMCITGIEIVNDYIKNTFPIFKVNFALEEDVYYKILNNKTDLKIKLRIQKYFKSYSDNINKSLYRDYINDTFIVIDDDNDVNRASDIDFQNKLKQSRSEEELEMFDTPLELYLYKEEVATGMKTQINDILSNVTLSSAIGYLFHKSGIKNALVSPLENNKNYKELLLPPLTINNSLAHLDAMYGFYKYGSVIFFGLDRSYILNFKGGCTAFETGEPKETCIYIPKLGVTENGGGGSVESDSERSYICWNYESIKISNGSVSNDILLGTDVKVINKSLGTITESSSKATTNGKANKAIIENNGENPWIGTTFTAQSASNSLILSGFMGDVDLSSLTPNKKFTMIFEDQNLTNKYKGTYFLSKSVFKFMNDSASGDFSILAGVEFRRLQKTT